jgi:hypothetical protein
MKDYLASVEKLRRGAAEAALIRDLATETAKRAMYDRLHLNRLADEVARAMGRAYSGKPSGRLVFAGLRRRWSDLVPNAPQLHAAMTSRSYQP